MTKNKMMRIASVLLVAVLLSSCVIAGTFAKYTTASTASDTARVAKWGVELQVVGNLFGDSYIDTQVLKTDTAVAVQSVDQSTGVVAPGTSNTEGFTFSLNGVPEVAGQITSTMKIQNVFLAANTYALMLPVNADITAANFAEFSDLYYLDDTTYKPATAFATGAAYYTLEDQAVLTANYYPVVYKLEGDTQSTSSSAADSLQAAADVIAAKLGLTAGEAATDTSISYGSDTPVTFAPNTDLATTLSLSSETLTWAWAFSDNDAADTILGLLENTTSGEVVKLDDTNYVSVEEYTDYCLDTMFQIEITVTQTDTYTTPTPTATSAE